jgi:hypothetical protein
LPLVPEIHTEEGNFKLQRKDRIFDSRVLRIIFGPEWKEVTEK